MPVGSFTEVHDELARPRALLSIRAAWWAIGQLRHEHASVQGLAEKLTDRQWARLSAALDARPEHEEVGLTRSVAQKLRLAYRHPQPAEGRRIAEQLVTSLPTCLVPELARLGRTLRRWRDALAYFDTDRSSNGGTEAINGLIELQRRNARGFRNIGNCRLRMLLIGGGLTDTRLP